MFPTASLQTRERLEPPSPAPPLYRVLFSSHDNRPLHSRSVKSLARKFLPIIAWLPPYRAAWLTNLRSDFVAGLTIVFIAIPQTLSYAGLASLPPIYGLYAAIIPPIIYAFLGTSKVLSIGVVAINCLIITSTISPLADPEEESEKYIALALVASGLAGVLSVILGFLKQGSLVKFISPQVLAGFITGSAAIILVNQLKGLLGISAASAPYAVLQMINVLRKLGEAKWIAVVNGLGTLSILLLAKYVIKTRVGSIVMCILTTVAAFLVHTRTSLGGLLPVVGFVPPGPPRFSVPSGFAASELVSLIVPACVIFVVGFLQSYALASKFAELAQEKIDADQELIALGSAKVVGAFFQAIDTPGSFSRTAINYDSGAKSQISHIFSTLMILFVLYFATGLLFYVPKSTLAAIVVVGVLPLLELPQYVKLWKVSRLDTLVALITAFVTFMTNAQIGIAVGVAVSFLSTLSRIARPHWAILGEVVKEDEKPSPASSGDGASPTTASPRPEVRVYRDTTRYEDAREHSSILIFRFDGSIYFLVNLSRFDNLNKQQNCDYWKQTIENIIRPRAPLRPDYTGASVESLTLYNDPETFDPEKRLRFLILDFSAVSDIDASGADIISRCVGDLEKKFSLTVLFASVRGPVRDSLWKSMGEIKISPDGEIMLVNISGNEGEQPASGTQAEVQGLESGEEQNARQNLPVPVNLSSRFFLSIEYADRPPVYKALVSTSGQRKSSSKSMRTRLIKHFPVLDWLPAYPKDWKAKLKGDMIAGFTIAVIAIPQTISYAGLASMPPVYGLYAAIVPPFIYAIFGTSRVMSVGLVAINSIITTSTISPLADPELETDSLALAAAFSAGVLSLLFGYLKQGKLVKFIAPTVFVGFVTGSSLVIMVNQMVYHDYAHVTVP
ncbi:MAG: hypothetical protein SGCHY_002993 [Lobulomycetales sp.]